LIGLRRTESADFVVRVNGGQRVLASNAREWLVKLQSKPIGDLYLNSIDRDGTGQGLT
jgi:imidazole glycerol phosphate synthase subunit HisF